jgi:hypothetical protein
MGGFSKENRKRVLMKLYLSHLYGWLVLLIICGILLTGCSGSNNKGNTPNAHAPKSTATSKSTTGPQPGASPTSTSTTATPTTDTGTTNTTPGALPGEQIWKNGASSYIFGTTDTGEWNAPNIEFADSLTAPGTPNTAVQGMVKQAGFTLMRKFIGHHDAPDDKETTDAALQAIGNTMKNTGTQCLVNIFSIDPSNSTRKTGDRYTDLQFAQHIATMYDGNHAGYIKCSLFEIGNEPDINGLDPNGYLDVWNTFVTAMKQVRPDAKFIGPVLAGYNADYLQDFLQGIVQKHYPVPNAIDWHYYPCGWSEDVTWQHCFAESIPGENPITQAADIRAKMQNILGYQLPIGISEWSSDASGVLPTIEPQMSQFITQTLNQMVQAKLDFANHFNMQSFAAYGGLDMIDGNNAPRPYFYAFANSIKQYKP